TGCAFAPPRRGRNARLNLRRSRAPTWNCFCSNGRKNEPACGPPSRRAGGAVCSRRQDGPAAPGRDVSLVSIAASGSGGWRGGGVSQEHRVGLIKEFSEWIQHGLEALVQAQPLVFFAVLFGIIFVETGLVVWPFLPGDSLLFFVGYLVHQYGLSFPALLALLV